MAPRLSLFKIIALTSTLLLAASTFTLGVILTTIIRGCGVYSVCSACSLVIGGLAILTLSLMIGIDLLHPGALMSMILAEVIWICEQSASSPSGFLSDTGLNLAFVKAIAWLVGTAFSFDGQVANSYMRSIRFAYTFLSPTRTPISG